MEIELSLSMKLFFKMKSLKRMLWFLTSRTFSKIWLPSRMIKIKESIKLHCLPTQIYQASLEKDFLLFLISVKTIMLISENLYMDFSRFITVIWKLKLNCRSMCMSHSFLRQYSYFVYDSILIFIFFRYDFDKDGYITKEDVRLILSHIPIVNTATKTCIQEGSFTKNGGGK